MASVISKKRAVRINNYEESGFDFIYDKGKGILLTNGMLNVYIYQKGAVEDYGMGNKDIIIDITTPVSGYLSVEEYKKLNSLIEKATEMLKNEEKSMQNMPQKAKIIKNSDIVVGGIYQQEDGQKVICLGEGFLYRQGREVVGNREKADGGYYKNVYCLITDENKVIFDKEKNLIILDEGNPYWIGTFSSKKSFVKCLKILDVQNRSCIIKMGGPDFIDRPNPYFDVVEFDGKNKFKSDLDNVVDLADLDDENENN